MAQPKAQDSQLADRDNNPMVANQGAAITAPTGGATVDAEARTAINDLISALEAHGLVADN